MRANTYHAPQAQQQRERKASNPDILNFVNDSDLGYLSRRIGDGNHDGGFGDSFGTRKLLSSTVKVTVSPRSISRCIALILKELIMQGENSNRSVDTPYEVFDKPNSRRKDNILRRSYASIRNSIRGSSSIVPASGPERELGTELPSLSDITKYIFKICHDTQMEYECAVVSLYYIKKLASQSNGDFFYTANNWRSAILIAMLMANKMWDDFHMTNLDYTFIFPGVTLCRINELEVAFFELMDCNLSITRSNYTRVHYAIQAIIAKDEISRLGGEGEAASGAEGAPRKSTNSEISQSKTVSSECDSGKELLASATNTASSPMHVPPLTVGDEGEGRERTTSWEAACEEPPVQSCAEYVDKPRKKNSLALVQAVHQTSCCSCMGYNAPETDDI